MEKYQNIIQSLQKIKYVKNYFGYEIKKTSNNNFTLGDPIILELPVLLDSYQDNNLKIGTNQIWTFQGLSFKVKKLNGIYSKILTSTKWYCYSHYYRMINYYREFGSDSQPLLQLENTRYQLVTRNIPIFNLYKQKSLNISDYVDIIGTVISSTKTLKV